MTWVAWIVFAVVLAVVAWAARELYRTHQIMRETAQIMAETDAILARNAEIIERLRRHREPLADE